MRKSVFPLMLLGGVVYFLAKWAMRKSFFFLLLFGESMCFIARWAMRKSFLFLMLFASLGAGAQSLTLEKCWSMAEQHYPEAKDAQYYEQVSALRAANIASAYYPSLSANGQATYQSDVTHVGLSLPNMSIPTAAKDQYKLTVDLNQLVWDGGASKAAQNAESAGLEVDKMQVQTNMYALKSRVAQLFYGIVLKQQQMSQLEALKLDLQEKLKKTASGVKNGVVLKSNEAMLCAEIIKLGQEMISAAADKSGLVESLGILIGQQLPSDVAFDWKDAPTVGMSRPELELFQMQKNKLQALDGSYKSQRMPKIAAFGQAGYGRPGLNMLSDSFDTFYYVGIKMSWNVFDWNVSRNNRAALGVQQNLVNTKIEQFQQSQQMSRAQESANISKYEQLLSSDVQLVESRAEVAKVYSVMYDNGAIDAADYISRQTELKQAELNQVSHEVMLAFSKVNLNIINGK